MDGTVVVHLDNPDAPATLKRSGSMDAAHSSTLRCGQALSGTLRYAQERSRTLCFNLDSTVSRATDTFDCFNGLQKPQRPSRPQAPKEPKEPQQLHGWMLSFDSHLPIPQLSVKNQIIPPAKSLVRSHFDSVSSHKTGKEGQYIDVRPECSDKVRCAISMQL